jgi:hypothetical protein
VCHISEAVRDVIVKERAFSSFYLQLFRTEQFILTTVRSWPVRSMNPLPSRQVQDTCEFRCSPDQHSVLDPVLAFHEFSHAIEIITTHPSPPPPPDFPVTPYQVLLDHLAFRDPAVVADLFSPSTIFVSLSPIDTGNGFFAQKGVMTFTLTDANYKRFGLTGSKFQNCHYVVVREDQRQLLQKIRPCQPIEGILLTEDIGIYESHIKKFNPFSNSIDFWAPTKPFEFDVNRLQNSDLTDEWRTEFIQAIDAAMLSKHETVIDSPVQRITIQGFFSLSKLSAWIEEIGRGGWALLLVWDMVDIPASVLGGKHTLRGVVGGCDAVLFGEGLDRALRFQTVNFVES